MSTPIEPTNDDRSQRTDVDSSPLPGRDTNRNGSPLPVGHPEPARSSGNHIASDDNPPHSPEVTEQHSTPAVADGATIVARQRERFGGVKVGSAFFGWLTATGMAVLLIALLAAAGVAFGVATDTTIDQATQESQSNTGTAQTVGLVGAITLLVVLLLAYYCGGYVAGRMARFNGVKQGLAVWLWGVVMALIIAGIAALAGTQYDVFAQLSLPRLPINEGQVTVVGAIAIGAAILAALIGAVLGGLAGMRFHRTVDKAGSSHWTTGPPDGTSHSAMHEKLPRWEQG
ncbi:hypothetical protein ACVBEQ_05360 [Nakamurella sp. GG22]